MKIKVAMLQAESQDLKYGTEGAAAVDLRSSKSEVVLSPGEIRAIDTGLFIHIPEGYAGLVLPRSGQAKRGLAVANAPGLIDEDYRGEVKVLVQNLTAYDLDIDQGERIAQLMFIPYVKAEFVVVDSLEETERGTGGFGSTGVS
jgi:dUTP pyrophosphatase